jgi:O-methyltransferase
MNMSLGKYSLYAGRMIAKLYRRRKLHRLYKRYKTATMIPGGTFIENLEIAQWVAKDKAMDSYAVVECGTWRGGMAAALMETLGGARPYHFFDSFEGLPKAKDIDGEAATKWQIATDSPVYYNNCAATEEEFLCVIHSARQSQCANSIGVHKGWFHETVRQVEVGKIALLRLDGDWYESTMDCLTALFPRVAKGGYIIIDDYGVWDGCTRAVHDYLSRTDRSEPILRYGRSGVAYLRVS